MLIWVTGGGGLLVHIESLEVDFFGLPTGRFGLAVRVGYMLVV